MKKFTNEIKTGLVVVMAILVGIFFWLRTSNFQSETYSLKTYFSHADGVKTNSVVTLAGIEVGRVGNVDFIYEPGQTKIGVELVIDKEARVRKDSIAFIGTTGFIGDAFIGITPGNSEEFLSSDGVVISEDPVEMREIMKRADNISKSMDIILADIKTIVTDNKEKVDTIVSNLEETSTNFNEFSADIKSHPWKLLMKGKD